MKQGLEKAGLSEDLVSLVEDTTRNSAMEIMTAVDYIEMCIRDSSSIVFVLPGKSPNGS